MRAVWFVPPFQYFCKLECAVEGLPLISLSCAFLYHCCVLVFRFQLLIAEFFVWEVSSCCLIMVGVFVSLLFWFCFFFCGCLFAFSAFCCLRFFIRMAWLMFTTVFNMLFDVILSLRLGCSSTFNVRFSWRESTTKDMMSYVVCAFCSYVGLPSRKTVWSSMILAQVPWILFPWSYRDPPAFCLFYGRVEPSIFHFPSSFASARS